MAATIQEIALVAGVSKATVSLVLNQRPGVGSSTRERVLVIASNLGYPLKPEAPTSEVGSKTIRFLRIAKHGHVVNPHHRIFIADYIEGLEREAKTCGFRLEIESFASFDIKDVRASLDDGTVSGAVVLATELDDTDLSSFADLPVPLVFIDSFHDFLNFDFVDMDNESSVYEIIRYLYRQGHQEIGFVKGSIETRNFRLRERGFYSSLERLQLTPGPIFSIDSAYEKASEDMYELVRSRASLPTALFCANDILAYGCLSALAKAKISVPDAVSIVGFDNLPSDQYSTPPLTSMQVSKLGIGRRAIQLLVSRIEIPRRPSEKVLVGGELILRQSVRNRPTAVGSREGGRTL